MHVDQAVSDNVANRGQSIGWRDVHIRSQPLELAVLLAAHIAAAFADMLEGIFGALMVVVMIVLMLVLGALFNGGIVFRYRRPPEDPRDGPDDDPEPPNPAPPSSSRRFRVDDIQERSDN